MENIDYSYMDYNGRIQVSFDAFMASLWNAYVEEEGQGSKIFPNNKEFFENSFENNYDTACAVSLSDKWKWSDDFVFFNEDRYLVSFSHWDDENSPISLDKVDLRHLIDGIKSIDRREQQEEDNNISRVIHEALE